MHVYWTVLMWHFLLLSCTSPDSVSLEALKDDDGLPSPLDEGTFFIAQATSIEMSQEILNVYIFALNPLIFSQSISDFHFQADMQFIAMYNG